MTIYRQPQPAPTEPGWYYARTQDGTVRPRYVSRNISGNLVVWAGLDSPDRYEWFGPVPECRPEE